MGTVFPSTFETRLEKAVGPFLVPRGSQMGALLRIFGGLFGIRVEKRLTHSRCSGSLVFKGSGDQVGTFFCNFFQDLFWGGLWKVTWQFFGRF